MFFFKKYNIQPIQRDFNKQYLLKQNVQNQFNELGYVILRNVISDEELSIVYDEYLEIQENNDFVVNDKFESSGNFKSVELQKRIFIFIQDLMNKVAPRFADLSNCDIGDGGAFFIKPNTDKSRLEPHQDSTVIDENKEYAIFVWIPLCNITKNNGALYVLPKSHLWGNTYRSQHIPWAFRNIHKQLWEYMEPIYLNKGDIVLFDSSIIHASEKNNSDTYRIAFCGALLPKNHQKVEYLITKNEARKYYVDNTYWLDGGTIQSLDKFKYEIVENKFPNPINKNILKQLTSTR